MTIKFKGVTCEMTPVQQIQGRTRVVNKATLFIAPTIFDRNTGEPTYGTIDEAYPIECLDDAINLALSVPIGTPVLANVAIVCRTQPQQDGTRKGFVSLKLIGLEPEQQVQQPVQGAQQMAAPFPPQQPQQPQGYMPHPPFQPM